MAVVEKKKRSFVWEYFTLVYTPIEGVPNSVIRHAQCKLCTFSVVFNSPTNPLINHLAKDHNIDKNSSTSAKRAFDFSYACDDYENDDLTDNEEHENNEIEPLNKDKRQKCERTLVKWLVSNNQPALVVDNQAFNNFVEELNPRFKLPCRQTVTNRLIPDYVS